MDENQISYKIIGISLEIHRKYGPGYWNLPMKTYWLTSYAQMDLM